MASFDSDDLASKVYNYAPWDIFGEAEGIGRVKLVKMGDPLPVEMGYKVRKGVESNIAVKFR